MNKGKLLFPGKRATSPVPLVLWGHLLKPSLKQHSLCTILVSVKQRAAVGQKKGRKPCFLAFARVSAVEPPTIPSLWLHR